MAKFIIGGGLVGLLAADILGSEYKLIPHKASRYYSFNPALADDHFAISPRVDLSILGVGMTQKYRRSMSFGGILYPSPPPWIQEVYTKKVYGEISPIFGSVVQWEEVISTIRASEIYKRLLSKHMDTLTSNMANYGHVTSIKDGRITTSSGFTSDYDHIVSTIPLDALNKALGLAYILNSRDIWCFHVKTDQLDFEGANQVLVVDDVIPFYKVNKIGLYDYVFYCTEKISTPQEFFNAFCNNQCEIVNPAGTSLKSYIPTGSTVPLHEYKDRKITCIGSHAQWDDLVDLSSSVLRILDIHRP